MNRLKEYFDQTPEPERQDDFFVIETRWDSFAVTREVAAEVAHQLDQTPYPRWVVFRDLTGAGHRILLGHVYRISESTAVQRSAQRAFHRARHEEEKAERPWDDTR
jgi:hypothetical protein